MPVFQNLPIRVIAVPFIIIGGVFFGNSVEGYSISTTFDGAAPAYRKSTPASANPANNHWNYSVTGGFTQGCVATATVDQPAYLDRTDVENDIISAMQAWNAVSQLQWEFDTSTIGNADNRDHFCTDSVQDIHWYHEQGLTLAVATTASTNNDYMGNGADIRVNTYASWADTGLPNSVFRSVMIHELGHVMGIDHSTDSAAIMWPSINGVTEPGEDDRRAAQYLYGSELKLLDEAVPPAMYLGEPYTITFKSRFNGGSVTPEETRLTLNISVVGDVEFAVTDSDPLWSTVDIINPGETLVDIKQTASVIAIHKGVEAFVTNAAQLTDRDWYVTVRITPNSASAVEVRWRTHYFDPTAWNTEASGGFVSWKALGDIVPRVYLNDSRVEIDQQGYPAKREIYQVVERPTFNLNVNSVGVAGVSIGSGTAHGGITDYGLSVPGGTAVNLIAPATAGGKVFLSWDGCDSIVGSECNGEVHSDRSVVAHYGPPRCESPLEPLVYFEDAMESGVNGWSHHAETGSDSWVQQNSEYTSPTHSWFGDDLAQQSDQRLVSPTVTVPSTAVSPRLQFYTQYSLEGTPGSICHDGGILEYSTDSGSTWEQVDNSRLETNPYSATFSGGNPLSGSQGWCGLEPWRLTVVELSGLEGETINFRLRLTTDSSVGGDGWFIDDFKVDGCHLPAPSDTFFSDGFEN